GSTIVEVKNLEVQLAKPLNIDSVFSAQGSGRRLSYLQQALIKANRHKQDCEFRAMSMKDDLKTIRRHGIEMHKKFTLSLACLVFFFIGAPLGAIIRKGGLGAPLVVSVILFIIYYIIDNTGYKMAREGHIEVWMGMWLSSAVLLPLGVFVTYKAVNDSAVFNIDTYRNFFHRILGRRQKRVVQLKEVIIEPLRPAEAVEHIDVLREKVTALLSSTTLPMSYTDFWTKGLDRQAIKTVAADTELLVDELSNTNDKQIIARLGRIPVLRNLLLYQPSKQQWVMWAVSVVFPLGITGFLVGRRQQAQLFDELKTVDEQSAAIAGILRGEDVALIEE
ncbi:MAG: LptF/LptG family permease, partial [Muribaculaceae bacterium]|nr:LptF/LptG family permease [Muribaculaceae bacterium]